MTDPASSPCVEGQAGPRPFAGDPSDFAQVRRWRDAERARLRAERAAMPEAVRAAAAAALAGHLTGYLAAQAGEVRRDAVRSPHDQQGRAAAEPRVDVKARQPGCPLGVLDLHPPKAHDVAARLTEEEWHVFDRAESRQGDDRAAGYLAAQAGDLRGMTLAVYWPIKAEPDLRDCFASLRDRGAVLALPVPVSPPQPMTFRRWDAGARLERGFGGIPVPPETAPRLRPDTLLAPLIGWDDAGFRLGYGAGYFDRTLAALSPPPLVIGVGYQSARLPTIVPQRHDVPMHAILTETGLQVERPPLPSPAGTA